MTHGLLFLESCIGMTCTVRVCVSICPFTERRLDSLEEETSDEEDLDKDDQSSGGTLTDMSALGLQKEDEEVGHEGLRRRHMVSESSPLEEDLPPALPPRSRPSHLEARPAPGALPLQRPHFKPLESPSATARPDLSQVSPSSPPREPAPVLMNRRQSAPSVPPPLPPKPSQTTDQ